MNLPLVVADIGLMTSFSYHHVTLHRAKFDDETSSLNVFFGPKKAKKRSAPQYRCHRGIEHPKLKYETL